MLRKTQFTSTYYVDYQVKNNPSVAIVIPTKNQTSLLASCIESILEKTTYSNYNIIIIDTGSDDKKNF